MPQEMIRVGLVGVTGYTGMELARLLTGHPNMKDVYKRQGKMKGRGAERIGSGRIF